MWAGAWLAGAPRADVRRKLMAAGTAERHAFVFVTSMCQAPFAVQYLMSEDRPPLPSVPPDLPHEVTHLWLASTWNTSHGLRWSPDAGWKHFAKGISVVGPGA